MPALRESYVWPLNWQCALVPDLSAGSALNVFTFGALLPPGSSERNSIDKTNAVVQNNSALVPGVAAYMEAATLDANLVPTSAACLLAGLIQLGENDQATDPVSGLPIEVQWEFIRTLSPDPPASLKKKYQWDKLSNEPLTVSSLPSTAFEFKGYESRRFSTAYRYAAWLDLAWPAIQLACVVELAAEIFALGMVTDMAVYVLGSLVDARGPVGRGVRANPDLAFLHDEVLRGELTLSQLVAFVWKQSLYDQLRSWWLSLDPDHDGGALDEVFAWLAVGPGATYTIDRMLGPLLPPDTFGLRWRDVSKGKWAILAGGNTTKTRLDSTKSFSGGVNAWDTFHLLAKADFAIRDSMRHWFYAAPLPVEKDPYPSVSKPSSTIRGPRGV